MIAPAAPSDRDPGDEQPTVTETVAWRMTRLLDAGYPVDIAQTLADRTDIDLHTACRLLEDGATVIQAERILL